jgi:tripartite-type tricarboxylate transporter receptor subunit TctC
MVTTLCRSARRAAIAVAAAIAAFASMATAAAAQDWPIRPIRVVVAFAAGGTTDFVARLLGDKMRAMLGQSVIIDNKPGANGAIAAESVARSEPDGYTLFFSTVGAIAINPSLRPELPYSPSRDFVPVGLVVRNTTVLAVNPGLGVSSAQALAALARREPGAITMAITGVGAISHLALELFQSAAGVKFRYVPYRGASQALTDLLGGQVNGIFADVPVMLSQIKAGTLLSLGATSAVRSDLLPDVPTLLELGFADTVAENWQGVLAPAGTPPAIVARINSAFVAAVNDPDIRRRLAENGVTASPSTAAEFGELIRSETARWAKVIRDKGIKPES